MGFFWFIFTVIFFVLWLSAKSAKTRSDKEQYDKGYSEGYWALGDIVAKELSKKAIDRKVLEKHIAHSSQPLVEDTVALEPVDEELPYLEQAIAQSRSVKAASIEAMTPVVETVPVKTKQEVAERNLNVLLYMASFLIVAAAAAFIATNMSPMIRLAGLWLVIIVFYGVGLLLHAKVSYLKPAATAFVGTGLALIPFAGIALSQLGGMPSGVAWFITSVIGVVSYAVATLRLRSEVVGYLTVAFSLSFATSAVAVVSGPVVLYFVALIIASLLFHVAARSKATWVPELFKLPISQASQLLTPVTLIASLLAYNTMTVASYQIVFWVATLYYAVLWATERAVVYEHVTRVLASISIYLSIGNVSQFETTSMLFTVTALAVVQVAYSLVRVRLELASSRTAETIWLVFAAFVSVTTIPLWLTSDFPRIGATLQVALVFLASCAATFRFRSIYYAVPALAASLALPFVVGRWPSEMIWNLQAITWIFLIASAAMLGATYWTRKSSTAVQGFFQAAFWLYLVTAFLVSFAQGSTVAFIVSTSGLAVLTLAASYVYKQWWIEILPAILIIPIVALTLGEANIPTEWMNVAVIGVVTSVYALGLLAHHSYKQITRRNLMTVAAVILGFSLVFSYGQPGPVGIVALLLALFYSIISLLFRSVVSSRLLKGLFSVGYAVYPLVLLLLASSVSIGWVVLAFGAISTVYWIGSYVEKVPAVTVFANLAFIGFVATAWSWLKLDASWSTFGIAWVAGTVFYVAALVYTLNLKDMQRYYIHLIFTWIALGFVALLYLTSGGRDGYAAAATLLGIAGTIAVHGFIVKRMNVVEGAVYVATFALQRLVGITVPELNVAFYGHWWALTLLAVTYWRTDTVRTARLIVATAFVTISSGAMALSSGGNYQLLFLVEHVALLVAGVLGRASWALWWGLIATVLAVLYFLRSSLFLSLLFLGLTLLGIVIWRLVRAHTKK